MIHRLKMLDCYKIFLSTVSPPHKPSFTKFTTSIDEMFHLKFDNELHKSKFKTLQRLQIRERQLTPSLRNQFQEKDWLDDFYTSDMAHTPLLTIQMSDDEAEAEDSQEPERASPAPKKFRKSILNVSRQQRCNRMSEAFSGVVSLAETEGITTVQAAAMLLQRAAHMSNKEVADLADCIVEGKFSTKWKKKLPVESASLLMSTLQI